MHMTAVQRAGPGYRPERAPPRRAGRLRPGNSPKESLAGLAAAGVMGLPMAESAGGGGGELAEAVTVIRKLNRERAARRRWWQVLMHFFPAAAVIDRFGPDEVGKEIAAGEHLSTLAAFRVGLPGQLLGPTGNCEGLCPGRVRLDAEKSWITADRPGTDLRVVEPSRSPRRFP